MEEGADSEDSSSSIPEETAAKCTKRSPVHTSTSTAHYRNPASGDSDTKARSASNTQQSDVNIMRTEAGTLGNDELEQNATSASQTVTQLRLESDELSPQSDRADSDDEKSGGPSGSKIEKKALRKGKWVVEEEEYTSRVIQHFSAGLLTLPEGATLRSYLAEKLSCDPMRITKKFTGACCLGRRVYHLRDRPRASQAELEVAQAERDHLEQRFRVRLEHEVSGLPISRRRELILSQPTGLMGNLFPMQTLPAGNTLSPWLQNYGSGLSGGVSNTLGLNGANPAAFLASARQLLPGGIYPSASRFLVPGPANSGALNTKSDPSLLLLNNLVASWAVAQAAVSLPPVTLSSLAASPPAPLSGSLPSRVSDSQASPVPGLDFQRQLQNVYEVQRKEEEKRQLRAAFEEQKEKTPEPSTADKKPGNQQVASRSDQSKGAFSSPSSPPVNCSDDSLVEISPAEQLQKSYEAHLQSLKEQNWVTAHGKQGSHEPGKPSTVHALKNGSGAEMPIDEEEAGTVLLGFLNSLRQSYEDAVENKGSDASDKPSWSSRTKSTVRKSSSGGPDKSSGTARRPPEVDMTPDDKRADQKLRVQYSKVHSSSSDDDRDRNLSTAVSQFMSSNGGQKRPASVTDVSSGNSSSQPTEFLSSLEDSSDKTEPSDDSSDKTDQSSSEEEKDEKYDEQPAPSSKGPPRKRLKGAFTKENLMVHSRRMSKGTNYN